MPPDLMFDTSLLANWLGVSGALCVHSETCGTALALEHNGDVYSCDHFVESDYLLGNIEQTHMLDLVASPQQVAFGQAKRDSRPSASAAMSGSPATAAARRTASPGPQMVSPDCTT